MPKTREVTEVYAGSFPSIHLSSECHCPPSHPLIDANNPAVCIQHPPNQGRIDRINPLAHPPSFANDFGTTMGWISAAGERNITITFHLTNSLYEVRDMFQVSLNLIPRPLQAFLRSWDALLVNTEHEKLMGVAWPRDEAKFLSLTSTLLTPSWSNAINTDWMSYRSYLAH